MNSMIQKQIKEQIKDDRVVLYMKGNKSFPQCGFSARVVDILNKHNVDYQTHNVLTSADIRSGIKEYSSWPTIPQLYVDGTFIGGCDIICDMEQSGDLEKLLNQTTAV